MIRQVTLAALTTAALATGTVGTTPRTSASAAEAAPHVINGVVHSSTGLPAPGTTVDIAALTFNGTAQEGVPLGSALADATGQFTVYGDLPAGHPVVSDEGEAYLIVRAANEVEGVITGVTAVPPSPATPDWTLPAGTAGSLTGVTLTMHNTVTRSFAERPLTLGQQGEPGAEGTFEAQTASADLVDPRVGGIHRSHLRH